jgi:hypothetical protein
MTTPAPVPGPAGAEPADERMVTGINVRCDVCKAAAKGRRRGTKGGWGPRQRPAGCTCRRIHAEGYGPGASPPPIPPEPPTGEGPV